MVVPYYGYLATAQYADIVLSFYLTASLITAVLFLRKPSVPSGVLAGLALGWMGFVKNEGIVCLLLLFCLVALYTLLNFKEPFNRRLKQLFPFVLSLIAAALPAGILKLFLAPENKDIFSGLSVIHMKFLNAAGLHTVGQKTVVELAQQHWGFIWLFLLGLFVLSLNRLFRRENTVLFLFFVLFLAVLTVIYLTTTHFSLAWRLTNTLPRILFYLLPALLFSFSYIHWRPKEEQP